MSDRVTLLMSIALQMMERAQALFEHGAGQRLWPTEDGEELFPGVIDEVNPESDAASWMNAVLGFLRFVYAINRNAIEPDYYLNEDN